MKGFGDQSKKKQKYSKQIKPSMEEILNQAFALHSQGNILEAGKYYQYVINHGFNDQRVFSNYGLILKDLGKLQEAEIYLKKSISVEASWQAYFYYASCLCEKKRV